MANAEVFKAPENGALFFQSTLGSKPGYLPCYDLDDITSAKGSKTVVQFYNQVTKAYQTLTTTTTPPDLQTVNLTTYLGKAAEALETFAKRNCTGKIFVNMYDCGKPNIMQYDRLFVLDEVTVNQMTYMNLVKRLEGGASEVQFELSFSPTILDILKLQATGITNTETEDFTDVAMYSLPCESECPQEGQYGFAVSKYESGASPADKGGVWFTQDFGGSWTATATQPFAVNENISSVITIPMGDAQRVVVARGTTDAGNPAEVAYSDDEGATWVNVNVGTANGTFVAANNAMFAADADHLWVGLSDGTMWFSENGGVTFEEQASALADDVLSIHFMNELRGFAGGATNGLMSTVDGGVTWSAVTAPSARAADGVTAVWQYSSDNVFIAYSTGYVYLSGNRGTSWDAQSFVGVGTGAVTDLFFVNGIGFMTHNNGSGTGYIFRTFDAGADWERYAITNDGINAIWAIDHNNAVAVGDTTSGFGLIAKVVPA